MNKAESVHKTVLLNETIEGLNLKDGALVIDGTFGGGGHSALVCETYPKAKIIAIDQDANAFAKAKDKFKDAKCDITFVNENFRNLDKAVGHGEVDGIILDLGLSSDQLENSGRGFSFLKDEPLLMLMKDSAQKSKKENPSSEVLTAHEVVNTWEEKNLSDIIYGYGEERFANRIARGIVQRRVEKSIDTTFDLVKVIEASVPAVYRRGKLHPATKTFQAIRIAVNDELGALREGLEKGIVALKVGGRMSVISFHSLEDRIVKKFFKERERAGEVKLINKKPIIPTREEIIKNSRSRSAKLRVIEKIK